MSLALTILIVIGLVAVRLCLPPVPALLKGSVDRFGKRTTMMLCGIALAGAALWIVVSGR